MAGVTLYGFGSLVAGVAPTVGWLLVGRVIQGLGPAIVTPTSLAIISATFDDPRERAAAIGVWSSGSGLALALGPAVGGLLVDTIGWRSVFLLNVPLAAAAVALGFRFIPVNPRSQRRWSFDWTGALADHGRGGVLTFGLIEGRVSRLGVGLDPRGVRGGRGRAARVRGLGAAARGAADRRVAVRARAVHGGQRGRADRVLRVHRRASSTWRVLPAGPGALRARSRTGRTPDRDRVLLWGALSGRLVGRFGPRLPMVFGLCLCGAGMVGLVRLRVDSSIGAVWWDLAAVGLGGGLSLTR